MRFSFPALGRCRGVIQSVFTRKGGASSGPFRWLNLGFGVGEDREVVRKNLGTIIEATGIRSLALMNQTHSDRVAVMKGPPKALMGQYRCDALISDIPGVGLLVRTADCQGVLFLDPEKRAWAAVHCGWRGAVKNILEKVIREMEQVFGTRPEHLMVAIGPSLGPCCGEFKGYREIFPKEFRPFMVRENYFDMWAVSCWQLTQAGIREKNIEVSAICTRCSTALFYSYRAQGTTGRFGTLICMG